jgi:hypothetical protein
MGVGFLGLAINLAELMHRNNETHSDLAATQSTPTGGIMLFSDLRCLQEGPGASLHQFRVSHDAPANGELNRRH